MCVWVSCVWPSCVVKLCVCERAVGGGRRRSRRECTTKSKNPTKRWKNLAMHCNVLEQVLGCLSTIKEGGKFYE